MSKINVLGAEIFNRIAAGEVVERPASIAKELIENSIDAGATSIVIEIKHGGKDYIKVSDNGHGIAKDDLAKAFLPHATSKIMTIDDLDCIGTLGFRGEALPSILAVADVKIVSKPAAQELGAVLTYDGVHQGTVEDVGSPDGTYFTVSNVFARIPARAKFMEKDFQEEAAITDLVSRLILSHTEISFRYLVDSKKIYQSYGQGNKDALTAIYGAQILNEIIEIDCEQGGMKLNGFIGRESFTKPNRTYQTLIVNQRYVSNSTVTNAVYYAYAPRLMKRQYPFYVLYLALNNDRVDVNVHPNKLDVRFDDKNAVYSLVNVTVAHALAEGYLIPNVEYPNSVSIAPISHIDEGNIVRFQSRFTATKEPNTSMRSLEESSGIFARASEIMQATRLKNASSSSNVRIQEVENTAVLTENLPAEYREIGVAFDTYLILQMSNELYWIDQHAAHERLLYDKIKTGKDALLGTQNLLIPYIFRVNAVEDSWLRANIGAINECGIEMDMFGDKSYKVNAVPLILAQMNLSNFVRAILADTSSSYLKSNTDIIGDKLMQEACKAAVKGGERLSEEELGLIVQGIASTKATLMCPHGRPIAIKIDRATVEKWFKRIVS